MHATGAFVPQQDLSLEIFANDRVFGGGFENVAYEFNFAVWWQGWSYRRVSPSLQTFIQKMRPNAAGMNKRRCPHSHPEPECCI